MPPGKPAGPRESAGKLGFFSTRIRLCLSGADAFCKLQCCHLQPAVPARIGMVLTPPGIPGPSDFVDHAIRRNTPLLPCVM